MDVESETLGGRGWKNGARKKPFFRQFFYRIQRLKNRVRMSVYSGAVQSPKGTFAALCRHTQSTPNQAAGWSEFLGVFGQEIRCLSAPIRGNALIFLQVNFRDNGRPVTPIFALNDFVFILIILPFEIIKKLLLSQWVLVLTHFWLKVCLCTDVGI